MKLALFVLFISLGISSFAQQGSFPISLSYPMDLDTIEEHDPTFTWQTNTASIESDPRLTQRFVLCELLENQTRSEAILLNQPIMIVDDFEESTLPFSTSANELEDGKTYVWQVSLIYSGAVIQVSDVSQFTLAQDNSNKNYLQLKSKLSTMPYEVDGTILRVSVSSIKELSLTAEVRTEEGELKTVTLIEMIDGNPVQQSVSSPSTDTRFFELKLKDFNIKKGIHVLKWSPVVGENYELLFERI